MINRILLYLSGSVLRISVFFGISIVCFSLIATNPQHLKNIISDTEVYDSFTPAVISDSANQQSDSTFPINDPEIQAIIAKTFDGETLKRNTEKLITGTYSWLEGDSSQPQFTVDFTKERREVANTIASRTFERLRRQPVCFAVPETFDPFTAGCQPPSTNLDEEQQKFADAIAGNDGILPKATFTANDLPRNTNNQAIYERYSYAPTVYTWLRYSPIIVGVLMLAAAVCMVLCSSSKRRGFQQLGIAIIASASALIMTPILFNFVIPSFTKSVAFNTASTSKAQDLLAQVMNEITTNFYLLILNVGLQLVLIGAVILLAEKITRPKSRYSNVKQRAGIISSYTKKPSASGRRYKPAVIPVQSSEESTRRKPRRTKNKKYRKIPRKGLQ